MQDCSPTKKFHCELKIGGGLSVPLSRLYGMRKTCCSLVAKVFFAMRDHLGNCSVFCTANKIGFISA